MSNHYFQFKQFKIEQAHCAMKVSTDACIQGAWTPVPDDVKNVLDIGTGTGLLSLMLAQKHPGIFIDAIELDDNAAQQAKDNVSASPWADRINVIHGDVCLYPFTKQYDLIICNPPFFTNSLLGDKEGRNMARHTLSLTYTDLLGALEKWPAPDGYACIMLPSPEHAQWSALLQQSGWHISQKLFVKPSPTTDPNRIVSLCSRNVVMEMKEETLTIRNPENDYTQQFKTLLSPYYLQL